MRSSEVPGPSDKWKDVDLSSLCIFNELLLEPCDNEVMFSRPIDFVGSSTVAIDYAKDFLRRQSTPETYCLQNYLMSVMMQILHGLF